MPAASVAGDSSPSLSSKLVVKTETHRGKTDNPASTCKSRRNDSNFPASHSSRTFSQFYGTNGGKGRSAGANAFGKCVSTTASGGEDSATGDDKAGTNPAMTCKAMQANDFTHFQTAYGTKPNAFGKCVSTQADSKMRR